MFFNQHNVRTYVYAYVRYECLKLIHKCNLTNGILSFAHLVETYVPAYFDISES